MHGHGAGVFREQVWKFKLNFLPLACTRVPTQLVCFKRTLHCFTHVKLKKVWAASELPSLIIISSQFLTNKASWIKHLTSFEVRTIPGRWMRRSPAPPYLPTLTIMALWVGAIKSRSSKPQVQWGHGKVFPHSWSFHHCDHYFFLSPVPINFRSCHMFPFFEPITLESNALFWAVVLALYERFRQADTTRFQRCVARFHKVE